MKRYKLVFLFLLFYSMSCKTKDASSGKSENNIDAARNFIRASLDGKFNDAREYLLADSVNTNYLDVVERAYANIDQTTKDGYRSSTIRVLAVNALNDSVSIIIYSNSFKNDPDTLRVLRIKDQWLIDLKYLYLHDQAEEKDSLP